MPRLSTLGGRAARASLNGHWFPERDMRTGALVLLSLVLGSVVAGAQADRSRSVTMRDLDGRTIAPFRPDRSASVIFFVATDCPISNSYAPEIQRVCRDYGPRGVSCSLMYEDVDSGPPARLDGDVRKHLQDYRYTGIPAAVDRARAVAKHAKASITPQVVAVDRTGAIRYRGRIDNFYAALGKPRQQVTEHDLRDALDAVLAGKKVQTPKTEAFGCYIVPSDPLTK